MKKIFLILVAIIGFGISVNAQVSFSCYYREYCDWNDYTQRYETNCKGYEESSLFEMNEKETMFYHTCSSIKSTYFVKEKEYDSKNDVYTYYVVSDAGNKYYVVFDLNNKQIRFVILSSGQLLRFYVKNIF